MPKIFSNVSFFYFLFFSTILFITFSNPFLRVPYDMWYHLERVEFYSTHHFSLFEIKNKELWPFLWGSLFSVLTIDELFTRTKIIHVSQTLISFVIIYFTAHVMIRNLFKKIDALMLKYLALWSVLIWFTIYATFSVSYHQVWILWYSINYQITLLFFWYIIAITFILAFEKPSRLQYIFYLIQIGLASILILWMHASEYIYVLMYFMLFFLIYFKNVYYFFKKHFLIAFVFFCMSSTLFYYFITGDYIYRKPLLFNYLNWEHISELYPQLFLLGNKVVHYYSRSNASLNELIYLSLGLFAIIGAHLLYTKSTHLKTSVHTKLYLFLLLSALFIFIPIHTISAGIASLLFAPTYVNRFYYASSIYILLPSVIYYFFYKKNILIINSIIFSLLLFTFMYSKYFSSTHNYAKNIYSVIESFKQERIGFNLSQEEIKLIGQKLKHYESTNTHTQKNYYYARDDIALVIKYIYKKPVLWTHRGNKNYIQSFYSHSSDTYHPVLFEVPKTFTNYSRYK